MDKQISAQTRLSVHGRVRQQQRGIRLEDILSVLTYGKVIHKQGLKFHHLPKAVVRSKGLNCDTGISNLIVITDGFQKEVVTCYKSTKALQRIKKKSKYLLNKN